LAAWLGQHEGEWSVVGTIGQRMSVSPNRVRIPDLALLHKGKQPPIVTDPPVLVVEILSPNDSYSDTEEESTITAQWGSRRFGSLSRLLE
jgi:Uma2 family endonuclease